MCEISEPCSATVPSNLASLRLGRKRCYEFVAPVSDARTGTDFAVELLSPRLVGRNTQLDVVGDGVAGHSI
jgi:hypothetical protein